MNALKQGGPSMKEVIPDALANESGKIEYELDRLRRGYFQKLPHMDWWMFLVKIEGPPIAAAPQLKLSLERFVPALQKSLNRIDRSVNQAIKQNSVDINKESAVRKLLRDILDGNLPVVEADFVDTKGVKRYIEPPEYKNFQNQDLSSQEHVIAMQKNPVPRLSSGFMTPENFLGVTLARPLYDSEGKFAGHIKLMIRPELLIAPLLKRASIPEDYELWIMQPDGMLIFDQVKDEIGRMLFSDPLYADHESLLELGKEIAAAPTGEGRYIFLAPELKDKAIKKAVWQTVSLHGREWRVVLAYRPYD